MSNQVVAEFFSEAGGAVALMARKVALLADLFRRGELQEANNGLSLLSSELRDFVVMIGVLQGPLEIEAARLTINGVTPDEQIARLGEWIESITAAQSAQDWPAVALILERDLEPVLRGWTDVLQTCAAAR